MYAIIIIPSLKLFHSGGSYKSLKLNTKRTIDMGTRLALKIHKREEGDVKPKSYVFILKIRTEERIMEFPNMYVGGEKY